MKVLLVVEDDLDMRTLIQITISEDPRFEIVGEAASAEDAIKLAETSEPGLIILDHSLEGDMTGLEAAPKLKAADPLAKIILFTAHEHVRVEAKREPAIDAFLLKTDLQQLLALAQQLTGLGLVPN